MALLRYALNDHPDIPSGAMEDFFVQLYHADDVRVVGGFADVSDPLTIDILIAREGFVLVEDQDEAPEEEEDAGSQEVEAPQAATSRKSRRKRPASS